MIPIQTQILDEIGNRLKNIKKVNGYFSDVIDTSIKRATLDSFPISDLPAINYWYITDDLIEKNYSFESRSVSVVIEIQDSTRDRPFVDVSSELSSDVWISLFRSTTNPMISDNPSKGLGDLVRNINLIEIQTQIGEGGKPFCGAMISLNAVYHIKPFDPFTLIN